MKGDFTRSTFKRENHYSSVRMQQGRVQLDADWNEQADITQHRIEAEALDLIGGCGGPLQAAGFHLVTAYADLTSEEQALEGNQNPPTLTPGDVYVSAGRYYLGGVLAQNERILTVSTQPHLPGLEIKDGVLGFGPLLKKILTKDDLERLGFALPEAGKAGVFHAYLDVWQRHITALGDPSIREKALGGPDTATRTQTVWQIKFRKADQTTTCLSPLKLPTSTGRLKAQTKKVATPPEPCVVPEAAGYRGLENQLYRVEIHQGGDAKTATFKWSRENGEVLTRWVGQDTLKPTVLKVETPGRDKVLGFHTGDWVELTDDLRELWGLPGTLVQVETVEGLTITVKDGSKTGTLDFKDFDGNPKIRRWDHHAGSQPKPEEAVLPVEEGKWIDLEQGIQVWFEKGGMYHTGDYWLIPARTASADAQSGAIEWPLGEGGKPLLLPRHGIPHHVCGLALLTWNGTAFSQVTDCRPLFPPVTQLTSFFYVSGDGQEAMPGDRLRQPLQVGVANGQWPVKGARVRFSIQKATGNGKLLDKGSAVDPASPVPTDDIRSVLTDLDGIAKCGWQLDANTSKLSQQVKAELLDAAGKPVHLPVIFTANLSVASQVAYDPKVCANLQTAKTVQAAIESLSQMASLFLVSGSGQEVMPNENLKPLVVLVASQCGPVHDAKVLFTVVSGGGTVSPATPVNTNAGIATCNWTLGATMGTQEVEATLLPDPAYQIAPPTSVRFTAVRNVAGHVAYNPEKCEGLAGVTNVQDAIDKLCERKGQEGCAITVGPGGQFASLEQAIKALLEQRRTSLCLCLMPGGHDSQGLTISPQGDLHLTIKGCGPGTRLRLKAALNLSRVGSFVLRDVEVHAPAGSTGSLMVFDQCGDVTFHSCHLMGVAEDQLVSIAGADRIHLAHNIIEAYKTNGLATPNNIFGRAGAIDGIQISTLFTLVGRRAFTRDALRVMEKVAALSQDKRQAFVTSARRVVGEARNTLSPRELESYEAFLDAMPAPSVSPKVLVDLIARIRDAGAIASPGTAIVIKDGAAHTSFEDNQIIGVVSLYGTPAQPDPLEEDLKDFANRLKNTSVKLLGSPGTLRFIGNVLTRLVLSEEIVEKIRNRAFKGSVTLYKSAFVTDNWFDEKSHFAARHLALTSNTFDLLAEEEVVGSATAASAIFVGNHAPNPKAKLFNVSLANEGAANLLFIKNLVTP